MAEHAPHNTDGPAFLPDEPVADKTGFELDELAKIPVKPPSLKKARKPRRQQWFIVLFGLALSAAGLLSWPLFGLPLAVGVMAAGATFVLIGTLLRL